MTIEEARPWMKKHKAGTVYARLALTLMIEVTIEPRSYDLGSIFFALVLMIVPATCVAYYIEQSRTTKTEFFYDINAYTNSQLAHLSIAVVTPSAEALYYGSYDFE